MNIESNEFKEWFGSSKVVDKDKKPVSVYHGTVEDFKFFQTDPLQKNGVNGIGENAIGSCFSESKDHAACYPFINRENKEKKVIEAYISIQKPQKVSLLAFCSKGHVGFL